ncbi:TetR/AcrR family transcriptional regulator [Actinomadura sp. 9N407]|uniref:TetR/AcrR family transcriptional regulator n=1 Tax=Actinomadura sp. 9N407 TaxID=3375154 RepID=UPI0037948E94
MGLDRQEHGTTPASAPSRSARLSREHRREALVDAAAELVSAEPIEAISIETVAAHMGVSRPLVYKHFANREELLAAVYERESDLLHTRLAEEVRAAESVEEMFRALIHGVLRAQRERGTMLAALRAAGGWDEAVRGRKRDRDRTTVRYFADRMARRLELDERQVKPTVAILLSATDSVLQQWRHNPTSEQAALLEEAYVDLVAGAMNQLAIRHRPAGTGHTG